ncbi:MAG: TatD family hydrolase [Candidatus Woesebacteria bacterium]
MIDSHTHLNLEPLFSDYKTYLQHALDAGVSNLMNIGVNIETSQIAVDLAKKHPELWASVGLHPEEAVSGQIDTIKQELENLIASGNVSAIGECGLDYTGTVDHGAQKELFLLQAGLAHKHELPLLIHCRNTRRPDEVVSYDAYGDLVDLLQSQPIPKFVLHCVSGPVSYVQKALDLGAYVSFAGNVTYPNAEAIRAILKITPQNRMLAETDAPFLSPQSKRGQTCEPAFVIETAKFIADFLGKSFGEIDRITSENAMHLFPSE